MSENDNNVGAPTDAPGGTAQPSAPVAPDEIATLKSRLQGQDAKITTLATAQTAAEARAAAAEAKLAQYEQGKLGADEALRAQLVAEQAKTAAAEQKAALALVKAEYPEAFKELGQAASALTPEQLASLEARLRGVAEVEPQTPLGSNPAKSGQHPPAKAPTLEDVEAQGRAAFPDWPWKNAN
jgi:hypothetical protein